ncbi:MAG: hypothetical protein GX660_11140, partial [Clostridiaceae bacterium]|nr:hypothetical protein [Clostridiaceae bacterium]
TDKDKNDFLTKAYEYMAKFFENSLQELEQRNPGISQTYRRIDANRFTAVIYKYGKETNRCKIWLKGHGVFENGIIYSEGSTADAENSYNETLVVKDDGSILYLHPSMGFPGTSIGDKLTFEGAAEYYWEKFIKSLQ